MAAKKAAARTTPTFSAPILPAAPVYVATGDFAPVAVALFQDAQSLETAPLVAAGVLLEADADALFHALHDETEDADGVDEAHTVLAGTVTTLHVLVAAYGLVSR